MVTLNGAIDLTKTGFYSLTGSEHISQPFHYTLALKTSDATLDFHALMQTSLTVGFNINTIDEVAGNGGLAAQQRFVTGVVGSYSLETDSDNVAVCYIDIYAAFWFLKHRRNTRIYHNKTLSDIINLIVGEHSLMQKCTVQISISSATVPIEYCVQYNESDFDFISRLLEHYGVWYYFKHQDGTHVMVITDDKGQFQPCPLLSDLRFQHAKNQSQFEEVWNNAAMKEEVYHLARREATTAAIYSTNDYNYSQAATELFTSVQATVQNVESGVTTHEFPGKYPDTGVGTNLSNLRITELEAQTDTYRGKSFVRSLTAGAKFTLSEHAKQDYNKEYVITSLSIKASLHEFVNEFTAILSSVDYRPQRLTPKPLIHGYLSGKVVAQNEGDEISTDADGRVLVYFQWNTAKDVNANTTMFIRVAQIWAGKGWGTVFIPRVGAEVIVAFLDGDPDRPVVIGTLYNSVQTFPYPQPDNKETSTILTRSTPQGTAGNELKLVDTAGSELMYLHAQKDWEALVENDKKTTVKHDDTLEVQNNRTITVKKVETHTVEETRSLTVKKDNTESYDQNQTINVTQDYKLTVNGNLTIDVTGDVTINGKNINLNSKSNTSVSASGGDFSATAINTKITAQAQASMSGNASTEVKSSGITTIQGSLVKIN